MGLQKIFVRGQVKEFKHDFNADTITIIIKGDKVFAAPQVGKKIEITELDEDVGDSEQRFKNAPTLEQIKEIAKNFPRVDPQVFYDYYSARGWKSKGQEIFDWGKVMSYWDRKKQNNDYYRTYKIENSRDHTDAPAYDDINKIKI